MVYSVHDIVAERKCSQVGRISDCLNLEIKWLPAQPGDLVRVLVAAAGQADHQHFAGPERPASLMAWATAWLSFQGRQDSFARPAMLKASRASPSVMLS